MKEVRWRKYDHDRTYLAQEYGTPLGWVDNLTGEVRAESDEAASAITEWMAGQPEAVDPVDIREKFADVEAAPPEPLGSDEPDSTQPPKQGVLDPDSIVAVEVETIPNWEDLALRQPGQAVRQQAQEELAANWQESKFRTMLQVAFDTHTDERAWRKGAVGEEAIGARLEKLSAQGWRVLHSVPVGENGSDIDRLAIGPGGVWTINTKNHRGKKIWVAPRQIRGGGHVVPYVRNSEFEANRVRRILLAAWAGSRTCALPWCS